MFFANEIAHSCGHALLATRSVRGLLAVGYYHVRRYDNCSLISNRLTSHFFPPLIAKLTIRNLHDDRHYYYFFAFHLFNSLVSQHIIVEKRILFFLNHQVIGDVASCQFPSSREIRY